MTCMASLRHRRVSSLPAAFTAPGCYSQWSHWLHKLLYLAFSLQLAYIAIGQAPAVQSLPGLPVAPALGMAYGQDRYVALFENNQVFTAGNNGRWQPLPADAVPPATLRAVAFGQDRFVAVGDEGTIYHSSNGLQWTPAESGTSAHLKQVLYQQGRWFAMGHQQTLLTSSNGEEWSPIAMGDLFPDAVLCQLAFAQGHWVLAAQHTEGSGLLVYHTLDVSSGEWSVAEPAEATLVGLSVLNDEFFLFTREAAVLRSADGEHWQDETVNMTVTLPNDSVQHIGGANSTWGGWYQQGRYFLYGYSEYFGRPGAVFSSADGWHYRLEPATAYHTGHAAMWVHQQLVLAGQEGFVYSTDGVVLRYFSGRFADAATNGQHIVAVGSLNTAGQIFASANQQDWTDRSLPSLREMFTVLYHDGKFIAAGNQQVLQSTDNGVSWQSLSEPAYIFFRMQYAAGGYVAFGRSVGGADCLLYSTNGIEWQEAAAVNDIQFYRLRYVGGHWLAMGFHTQEERGEIWQSADGLHWQSVTPALAQPIHSFHDVMFDGWRYHFAAVRTLGEGTTAPGAFCTVVTTQLLQPDSFRVMGAVLAQDEPGMLGIWEGQASFAWSNGYWVGTASDLQNDHYPSYLMYSRDGVTWRATSLGHNSTATTMLAFGHHFIALGSTYSLADIEFEMSGLPAVSTGQPELVYSTGVTLRQSSVDPAAMPLRTGVVIANHALPDLSDRQVPAGTNLQFTASVSGLQNNQQYSVRAFAMTAAGVAYGQVINFTTACNALVEGNLSENEDETVIQVTPGQAQPAVTGCRSMASIRPWGASPVSGTVAAKAWVRSSLFQHNGQLLVGRAFQLQPAQNAATATAIVTLYFSQTDFDDFNAEHSVGYLPAAPADVAGKSNLRIYKFGGTSADGSGEPGSFSSAPVLIDPADDSIVWNAGLQRWEISFPVTGFSGFFAGNTQQQLLPLTLTGWQAIRKDGRIRLTWQVGGAEPSARVFEIQRSLDGRRFQSIGQVPNRGIGGHSFTDDTSPGSAVWYRLAWRTNSGQALSAIIMVAAVPEQAGWQLRPNPAHGHIWLQPAGAAIEAPFRVVAADGRVHLSGTWRAGQPIEIATLQPGLYRLVVSYGAEQKSIPFNKQ